ncbi:MAG TPA: glycosyltransferase [Bryobacteraceae bacterium]|nr:glycosyltransferase [Bryobacteraceae bacterium]
MKVSVVVPAFNEQKLIQETLRRIKHACSSLQELGWETEVIVCDNNSTDATAVLAREEGARVVFEPVNQIGRARNTGAAAATGGWLIFIDADSHPSPELFRDVAAAISSGSYLAGGCTVQLEGFTSGWRLLVRAWNGLSRLGRLMAGSFIFCEREAFEAVGGFNLELYAKEEIDLSRKLKRLARKRQKKIVILHRHPLMTSNRKVKLYSRGEMLRFLVHNALSLGRTLRSSKDCFPWYDGRR